MASDLGDRGPGGQTRDRQRPGRVSRGARVPGAASRTDLVTERLARLGALLEEPLLVTSPTNLYYLCGLRSSNAALLVEPGHARLFSDFRYAEAGRGVEGVEFEETKRALLNDLAQRLSGRIGVEADAISYA